MGLSLSVGALAYYRIHDPEGAAHLRKAVASANRTLTANGLPRHIEPEDLPPIPERFDVGSLPYGWFDRLRRVVAYARNCPKKLKPLRKGKDASEDRWVVHELCTLESHLICHSDCDGLYVPVDFDTPLYSEKGSDIAYMGLGSSVAGLRELVQVAPLLDIELEDERLDEKLGRRICREKANTHPFEVERKTWLAFFEAFSQSIEYKSVVVFN
jgi:hypothetical protein